jgi:ubiquinone/menaquinone biosynthesis C-methylase UbiE
MICGLLFFTGEAMTQTTNPNRPVTPERIGQLAWSFAPPLVLAAAVQHKLFDALDGAPRTADEIAQRAGISQRGARMIANVLVGLDLLAKDAQGRYSLTPESATFLVTTKPSFQGGIFRHIDKQLIAKWLNLPEVVKTGQSVRAVNQESEGAQFFQQFVEDIFPMSYGATQALGDALKLSEAKSPVRVLDLAAGSGVWGIGLAQKSSQVRVTAVDWPAVIPVTRRVAQRYNVADRFTFIEGDIDEVGFGSGHNVATLGHILHSQGEQRSRELLKKTFAALAPGGTIAIAEFLVNDTRSAPPTGLIFAVNMLVNTANGDTFSYSEIARWLTEAGFTNTRTLDAPGPSPLILATRP